MFKKFKIHKILVQTLLVVLLTSITSISFAADIGFEKSILKTLNNIKKILTINNPSLPLINAEATNIFNDIHKIYVMLTELPQDQGNIQARYIEEGQVLTPFVKKQNNDLTTKFNNFIQYGQFTNAPNTSQQVSTIQNMRAAEKQPHGYTASDGITYSTTSAQSLLSGNMYSSSDKAQQNAAIDFIKNASGAYFAVPALPASGKKGIVSEDRLKYAAYQKMMTAIQSLTAANFVSNYADRLPTKIDSSGQGEDSSYMRLLNNMNTAEASNQDYWKSGMGSKSLFERAQAFFTAFFSINYTLHDIDKQLRQMNLQMSATTAENALLLRETVGNQLYKAVQRQEQSQAKFKDNK